MAMNREQKRLLRRQGQLGADGEAAPRRATPPPTRPSRERTSPFQFLREVRGELRKVAWPTWPEVLNSSIIVLVTLIIVTVLIAMLDWGFGKASLALFE